MGKLRYGLLGTGHIAVQHLEASKLLQSRMEIVALCDTDEGALHDKGDRYGIARRYTRMDAFLGDGDIDVVVVLTPPHIREEVVIPCLEAGKHVFVEKPFALTLAEAESMVRQAKELGRRIAVNQNYRWRPEVKIMRSLIDEGAIGDVLMINMNQSFWRDEKSGWRNTTDYLAISVMGVHWLDRFRWLVKDEAQSLYASFGTSGLLTSRGEDIASVIVNFRRGTVATLTHSWVSRVARGEADSTEIIGSRGSILAQGPRIRLYQPGVSEVREWVAYRGEESGRIFVDSFAESVRVFTEDVMQDRESMISGRDNLYTMALVDGAYRSSASKQPVVLATEY